MQARVMISEMVHMIPVFFPAHIQAPDMCLWKQVQPQADRRATPDACLGDIQDAIPMIA
jgi:hypothetical protein